MNTCEVVRVSFGHAPLSDCDSSVTNHSMIDEIVERIRNMPNAKRLAVAIYGESVAAYRYSVLADKSTSEAHRNIFDGMKEEEHGHQKALEQLAAQLHPDADFILSQEDKDLVIVGTRLLEIGDAESFRLAMQFLHDTEMKTARFYETMHELMPEGDLGRFLQEMAAECVEHGESLLRIDPPK